MLNRFGKDIETVDGTLAGSLQAVNSSLATFLASILTVVYVYMQCLLLSVLMRTPPVSRSQFSFFRLS